MSRRFSIIIVHRNGADMLLDTLACVARACDPARDEIILVDNASRDDSVARVAERYPTVRVIGNGCNNGFARACNQAIARAQGEFMLLLNNDAQVAPDSLNHLETHFGHHPEAALIGASLRGPGGERQNSGHRSPTFRSELGLAIKHRPPAADATAALTETDWVVGACLAVRRAAVQQAGALDPAFFFYYEDVEWSLRMRRHGWRVYVANDVPVVHLRGVSTRALRREALVEELRSRLIFYRKAFSPLAAGILTLHRILRLLPKSLLWGAAVLLTLGQVASLRRRAIRYFHPLVWVVAGMPANWGLPDRCPERSACLPSTTP